jgi:hypothetical protein
MSSKVKDLLNPKKTKKVIITVNRRKILKFVFPFISPSFLLWRAKGFKSL